MKQTKLVKLFSILLALTMIFALAACSSTDTTTEESTTAAAEIVWCDENGKELYRQQIELIEPEGSEEYGA